MKTLTNLSIKAMVTIQVAASPAFAAASSSQDIGDIANRGTGYGTALKSLLTTFAGVAGILAIIAGIVMLTKQNQGPQNNNKTWGWVLLLGGGALGSVALIQVIMGNSIFGA